MASDSHTSSASEARVEILMEVTRADGSIELYRADGTMAEAPSKLDRIKNAFDAGSF